MKNIALITGASSGIGAELAKIHAQKGGDLVLVARRLNRLEELKSKLESDFGVQVYLISKDLTKSSSATEIYQEILSQGFQIDILINNAGFGGVGNFYERDWESEKAMINLNIVALSELTHLFLPNMIKLNSGYILNISSTASMMPGPLQAVYFATKAYVSSFSNAISEELKGTGVSVTALLPGATATEFGEVSGLDKTPLFDKTFSAESVAKAGYAGMLNRKLNVLAGLSFSQKVMLKLIPLFPLSFVLKRMKELQKTK